MGDVFDVLGVQRGAERLETAPKPKETKVKRPEGMSREAFSLLDGSHPIMQSELAKGLMRKGEMSRKRKSEGSYHVVYQWKKFKNEAREDGLELSHWVKCYKDAQGNVRDAVGGDYPFAKFNKKVNICEYNDEEWEIVVKPMSDGWTREETDYLLSMCKSFDLRFVLIADRYDFPNGPHRTLEELKGRYYSIGRQLLIYREGSEDTIANHLLVKHPYSIESEQTRRNACDAIFKKTGKQEQDDNQVLEEAQKIEERRKHELNARKVASAGVSAFFCHPETFENSTRGQPSLFDVDLKPFKPPPGVYARGQHTRDIAKQQLMRMAGHGRAHKLVENTLKDLGCSNYPRIATRSQAGAWLALHAEVINLVESRKKPNN
ncbi:hypothetical protein BSKO_06050 [Bryopsis sp. KO-2023]|nr:hypothetical protein BSKO_06050 [Bryopsis sp. KO-2023]